MVAAHDRSRRRAVRRKRTENVLRNADARKRAASFRAGDERADAVGDGGSFAQGAQAPLLDEVIEHAGVIEQGRADFLLDPRRNQRCGHAHAVAREGIARELVRRQRGRRRHVVMEPAVLIVKKHEQRRVPQGFVAAQGVVDVGRQLLRLHHVVRRVVVVLAVAQKIGLDERKSREILLRPGRPRRTAPCQSSARNFPAGAGGA